MAGVARRKREMVDGLLEVHMSRFKESGAQLVMGEARFTELKTVQVTLPPPHNPVAHVAGVADSHAVSDARVHEGAHR
jgi:hypothetical protein